MHAKPCAICECQTFTYMLDAEGRCLDCVPTVGRVGDEAIAATRKTLGYVPGEQGKGEHNDDA
jgi:hypothetical protein